MLITSRCLLVFLAFFSSLCLGSPITWTSAKAKMILPADMKIVWRDEDQSQHFYRYLLRQGSEYNHDKQEMRLEIANIVPQNPKQHDQWQADTLGTLIAIFVDANHLSLEGQSVALSKKPDSVTLGKHHFKKVHLKFDGIDVEFLTAMEHNTAYMLTLAVDHKSLRYRQQALETLRETVRTAEFF